MKVYKILSALFVIVACVSCTQKTESIPGNVDEFIAAYEADLEKFETAYRLKLWEFKDNPQAESLAIYRAALYDFLANPQVTDKIERLRLSINDELLNRKMDIIYARSLLGRIEAEPDIMALKDSLRLIVYAADRAVRDNDYIYSIGRDLLRAEYLAGQDDVDKYGDMLLSLIRKRNIVAKRFGYNSYYSLVLKTENIEPVFIDSICRQLLVQTDEVFRDGISRITFFGEHNPMLFSYHDGVRNFITVDLGSSSQNRIVRDVCKSIGFEIDKMPIYYFFADSGIPGPIDLHSIRIPDDIRIAVATYPSLGSLEGLLENTGLGLYAVSTDQKDYLFRRPALAIWPEAIRHVFGCLMFEPEFLGNYLGITGSSLENWRKYREFYLLAKLRYRIFYALLEKELYTGAIPNVGKSFSDLYSRIFYSSVPGKSAEYLIALFDCDYPISAHNKLLGLLVAGQFYRHLKATNGQVVVGNPSTRQYLVQNCFRYGARYDWRELLKWGTGEDLKCEYYLDFSD